MSGVEALLRSDLRGFAGYASAAARNFVPRMRLDANESPWANPAAADDGMRCYPEPQPRDPGDARQPEPSNTPNPDEGGLGREPDNDQDPATDD